MTEAELILSLCESLGIRLELDNGKPVIRGNKPNAALMGQIVTNRAAIIGLLGGDPTITATRNPDDIWLEYLI